MRLQKGKKGKKEQKKTQIQAEMKNELGSSRKCQYSGKILKS